MSSIPGWGNAPGGEHGNLLLYSCLGNPMDRVDWWATVHRVAKSWTWLKQLSMHVGHIHTNIAIVIWGQDQVKFILPLSNFIYTIPILRGLIVYSKETTLNRTKMDRVKVWIFIAKQINIILRVTPVFLRLVGRPVWVCCMHLTKIQTFSITCRLHAVLLNAHQCMTFQMTENWEMFSAQLRTAVCQLHSGGGGISAGPVSERPFIV